MVKSRLQHWQWKIKIELLGHHGFEVHLLKWPCGNFITYLDGCFFVVKYFKAINSVVSVRVVTFQVFSCWFRLPLHRLISGSLCFFFLPCVLFRRKSWRRLSWWYLQTNRTWTRQWLPLRWPTLWAFLPSKTENGRSSRPRPQRAQAWMRQWNGRLSPYLTIYRNVNK